MNEMWTKTWEDYVRRIIATAHPDDIFVIVSLRLPQEPYGRGWIAYIYQRYTPLSRPRRGAPESVRARSRKPVDG